MPAHATNEDYSVQSADRSVVVRNTVPGSGAHNVFLPPTTQNAPDRRVVVYAADVAPDRSYSVAPHPNSGDTIQGFALVNLQQPGKAVVLFADPDEKTWWPEVGP